MTPFLEYKRVERLVAGRIADRVRSLANEVRRFVSRGILLGRERLTILLVPHADKRVVKLNLSLFTLAFAGLLLVGIVALALVMRVDTGVLGRDLAANAADLSASQAQLQRIHGRLATLAEVSQVLERAMARAMSFSDPATARASARGADPASDPPRPSGALSLLASRDIEELKTMTAMMGGSVHSIARALEADESLQRILADLPTQWPVKGRHGTVTSAFGPTFDPETGHTYLNTGVDIADWMGAPVVAAANGVVVMTAYEPLGYGNFVFIRHRFGFYTRYAHLMRIFVHAGQHVKQGQTIGLLGASGLSEGPHLHFEIWLGDQVINPMSFLELGGRGAAPATKGRN